MIIIITVYYYANKFVINSILIGNTKIEHKVLSGLEPIFQRLC